MKRECRIRAAATQAEKKALSAIARLDGRSPSECMRELIRDRAKELGVWDPSEDNATGEKAQ